jgi:RND family efflux transporter MFP subunit
MKSSTTENSQEVSSQRQATRHMGSAGLLLLIAAVLALGVAIYHGIQTRVSAETDLKRSTDEAAILTVNVVSPKLSAPTEEIVLPGNTQPFIDSPIFARASGYLKQWHADIGTHVKKGDLLAEIETPEIDQQLQQARGELATAKANLELAKTTAARWQSLIQSGSVSQQETDAALGDLAAKTAALDSSTSNVRRLEELVSFEKVYAPFDGIITARNTDIGALVDAGANAPGKELFHLTSIGKLRVFVSVPEAFYRDALPGTPASLTLDEFPGETFHGSLIRTSNSIDTASSTLRVEVDVDNPAGRLLPGAYIFVHLPLHKQVRSLTIPANTLLFRKEGLRVAVVRNGHSELAPVAIGRDYGDRVEVVSGLQPSDNIILDPPDSLTSGMAVEIRGQPAGVTGTSAGNSAAK